MRKAAQCFCEMKTSTRQTRKTICVSKLEKMHDIAIGLLINKVEFGRDIYAEAHVQPTTVFFIVLRQSTYRIIWAGTGS